VSAEWQGPAERERRPRGAPAERATAGAGRAGADARSAGGAGTCGMVSLEVRSQKADGRRPRLPCFAFLLGFFLLVSITQHVSASQLTVDRRTLTLDDHLTTSLVLDGPFTDLGDVAIPLRNLELLGDASSKVEFSWVNGAATYRRTLVYTAKAKAPGIAVVGPLLLHEKKGAVETLRQVVV